MRLPAPLAVTLLAALPLLAGCDMGSVKISEKDGVRVTAPGGATRVSITEQGGVTVLDSDGKTAVAQVGGAAAEATEKATLNLAAIALPYPGAAPAPFDREGLTVSGAGDGANVAERTERAWRTQDSPAKVAAFYDQRIRALGAAPMVSAETDRTATRVVVSNGGRDSLAIAAEARDGGTVIKMVTVRKSA